MAVSHCVSQTRETAPRCARSLERCRSASSARKTGLETEQEQSYRRWREEERIRLEQRFLLGADCAWTRIERSEAFYCRRNGRAFRIAQGKDKRWTLCRVEEIDDEGESLGTYQGRGDANKALKKIAYAPQPQR